MFFLCVSQFCRFTFLLNKLFETNMAGAHYNYQNAFGTQAELVRAIYRRMLSAKKVARRQRRKIIRLEDKVAEKRRDVRRLASERDIAERELRSHKRTSSRMEAALKVNIKFMS